MSVEIPEANMSQLTVNCQRIASPTKPQRMHATVEDVTDDDHQTFSDQSSPETTPVESRRNSFLKEHVTDEGFIARATSVLLRDEIPVPNLGKNAVGHCINQLILPKNFAQVAPGVFRSAFPEPENFTFLRVLGLKTILTLVPEEYPASHQQFVAQYRIQHFQIGIEPNKSPFFTLNKSNMDAALWTILDPKNHPILIHCNKGKHRTGCVVACTRKVYGWNFEDIITEYRKYAGAKARVHDESYIEHFDEQPLQSMMHREPISSDVLSIPEPFLESPVSSLSISTRLRS